MAEKEVVETNETGADSSALRIYEIGYHVMPSLAEDEVEKIVASIRADIEKAGGTFIAEGAPSMTRLAYSIDGIEAGKRVEFDRGYFGWIKFEAPTTSAGTLEEALKLNKSLLRHILFQTVREDTRAKAKMGTLREVRRTDVIKTTPKREEASAPVSEEQLDKALETMTAE